MTSSFDRSQFERLQDYLEGGCKEQLSPTEQEYYNALFATLGIVRKYGKDSAINMLQKPPFNCTRAVARRMFGEAMNLFYLDDEIENNAHRNYIFDNLMKAAQAVLLSATSAKDMEVYANIQMQAWKVKQLDKEDPIKRKEMKEKEIKVYTLDSSLIGVPKIDRKELAAQIDQMADIRAKDKERLKRDAGATDINFEEMLDNVQEETNDFE